MDDKTQKMLAKKVNLIFALADIQEWLAKDLEEHAIRLDSYKFDVKRRIKEVQNSTRRFREMATNILAKSEQDEDFGVHSDRLREIIFNELNIK